MIRNFYNEQWKDIIFDDKIAKFEKYKISNYGRVLNCKGKEEFLANESFIDGYHT